MLTRGLVVLLVPAAVSVADANVIATTPQAHVQVQARPVAEPEPPPRPRTAMMWLLEPVSRLDLASIPELSYLEPALQLDRHFDHADRKHTALLGSAGLGLGWHGGERGTAAMLMLAGGMNLRDIMVAGAHAELTATDRELVRGHHTAMVHAGSGRATFDVKGVLDHGQSRGLAPVRLGTGKRDNGDVEAEAMFQLSDKSRKDGATVFALRGGLGGTRWHDSPVLERARRRSIAMAVGLSPSDSELPRGSVDFVRARVEHAVIQRPIAAAGGAAAGAAIDTEVRLVEVAAFAVHDLTLHIDRELAGVIDMDLGWSWLESSTPSGTRTDDMFRMRLSTHLKWWSEDVGGPRRLGLAIAREPGYTPDGQRLVSDWRLQLVSGFENKRARFDARGGISWVTPIVGDDPKTHTLVRYGVHVEGFVPLASRRLEVGAYHAQWYEPQAAGDPWAGSREWSVESGVLARVRVP